MCNQCNGTHVVRDACSYMTFVKPCPTCGGKSEEQWLAEREVNKRRIAEAKQKFGMVGVSA